MAHRALVSLAFWLCLGFAGWVQPVLAAPLTFPTLTGRVVDQAGLLSPADRKALSNALAALETRTTDQVVVVTLTSLQGTTIEDYGYQLGRHWGIGQKDRDSGALLIVAAGEHQVRIEVGYGLEGTLTDAATKVIIETAILPAFKTGDFAGGIRNGTAQIIRLLDADAAASPAGAAEAQPAGPAAQHLTWAGIAGVLAFVILLIFCAIHGGLLCSVLMQILYLMMLTGRGNSSSNDGPRFSGGGGSFGGGGSSGSW